MTDWNGAYRKLDDLMESLRALSEVPSQASEAAAVDIAARIDDQFNDGVDPYGAPWKGLADSTIERGRFNPPLTDTRAGRESVVVRPMQGAGIEVEIGEGYMGFHQAGSGKMPARKILPEGDLPDDWEADIENRTRQAVKKVAGKYVA